MVGRRLGLVAGLCLGAATLVATSLAAQSAPAGDPPSGSPPPGRAARLSSVDGQVQLTLGGQSVTDHAVINTPLFEGMQVSTGNDGRAELQLDDGSVVRIPPESAVTLTVFKPDAPMQVTLNGGLGYFELAAGDDSRATQVRFDDTTITPAGQTVVRLDLDTPPGSVAVFQGNAHLSTGNNVELDLHGGESVALNAHDPGNYNLTESIEPDSWDSWNADRDQVMTTEEGATSPATQGMPNSSNPAWGDLNANGSWYNVPDQGYVWSPYAASSTDWDPYGSGYWMNTPGYGYTWVSGYSWGYMPYQCGMWNYYDAFGWGWAPGGCNTWWGGGAGWYFNVGTVPRWYKLPYRPGPVRPRNPRPMEGLKGVRAVGPAPIISVNRRMPPTDTVLPPRDKSAPVVIGGASVIPLRSTRVRPVYNHVVAPVHPVLGDGSPTGRPGYMPPAGSRATTPWNSNRAPVTNGSTRNGYAQAPHAAPSAPRSSSSSHTTSGSTVRSSPAPRSSSPPATHPK